MSMSKASWTGYYKKLFLLQDRVLEIINNLDVNFYLTGGTALSRFHLNHRYSDDLDFVSHKDPYFGDYIEMITVSLKESNFEVKPYGVSSTFAALHLFAPTLTRSASAPRTKRRKPMKKILIIVFLFVGLITLFPVDNKDIVNIKGLQSSGDDWVLVNEESSESGGTLKLFHDKWLMYFLHWRPLTKERENISVEYAKKLLLSFWGPDMPFTIKGEGGETEVGGHKAYFIDGTIYNNKIRTRFIIWNCRQTNRQFIADCNINRSLGTPERLLKTQFKITSTISCHGQKKLKSHGMLSQNFVSKTYDLSFDIPGNWRTHEYNPKDWFPKGMSKTNGTLWTLVTDSRKFIHLRWENKESKISKELLADHLKVLTDTDFTVNKEIKTRYGKLEVKNIKESDNLVVGDLSVVFNQEYKEQDFPVTYLSRAFLWNYHGKTYFLLTGLVCLAEVWNRPLDLSPTRETLTRFIKDEILPNIRSLSQ